MVQRYAACREEGARRLPTFRWVRPENLHVTLRFLGDMAEDRVGPLRDAIGSVAGALRPFRVELGEAGCFGARSVPQVLWFAIREGASELQALVRSIELAVRALGFEGERKPWRPHVTIARNPRKLPWREWEEVLRDWRMAGLGFDAREATLFSSILGPGGPTYTRLWTAPLIGDGIRREHAID
jgi:2'-5' RNA ligase